MNNPPSPPPPPPPSGGSSEPQPGYGPSQPGYNQPAPGAPEPGYRQPAFGEQPGSAQPAFGEQPGSAQPAFGGQPGYAQQPGYNQPGGAPQPGYSAPQQGYYNPQEQNPYAAQSQYGTPVAPYETGQKKKGRGLLIGGGIVVGAAVLIGGGVFAANALLGSSGTQPYEVLPGDSFAYAVVDFDPEADQKTAYMNIKDQLVEEFDLDEDADLFEGLATPLGFDLDYETDIEPWLGDRVGVSAVETAEEPEGMVAYLAYQIADPDKLGDVRDKFETSTLVQGEYLIISSSANEDLLPESGFSEVLEDREGFTSALDKLDGNTIASMWLDLGAMTQISESLGADMALEDEFGEMPFFELSGTAVAGLHLNDSYVQAQFKTFDLETGEDLGDFELQKGTVADTVKSMPANSGVALAVGGLDTYLNSVLTTVLDSPEMADFREMLEAMTNELRLDFDLFAAETITGLLGTTTGFYATEEGGALYSVGGNQSMLEQLEFVFTELAEIPVEVTSDGDVIVTRMGDPSSSGTLGESDKLGKALHNLDDAHFALYLEPAVIDPYTDDIGIIGITGQMSGSESEVTARWLLP